MQVGALELVAVGRMMDGGSPYWKLRDQDGSSYWVIPRMGIGAQKPWLIDLIGGKRPDGGFGKSVPVVAGSDLEKKLVAFLESASKNVDPQRPSAALIRARLDVLIGLLKDRWSHPRPLRLESDGRLEERYE